jgi:hypothetical protein
MHGVGGIELHAGLRAALVLKGLVDALIPGLIVVVADGLGGNGAETGKRGIVGKV